MNQLENEVTEVVKGFFKDLHKSVVPAGGYARSKWFGQPYKDVDLIVPFGKDTDEQKTYELACRLCGLIGACFSGLTTSVSQAYADAVGDFNDRIWTMVSIEGEGISMDVLVHREENIADVVVKFDSNVNQCAVSVVGKVCWWIEPPTLVKLLKPVSAQRARRLREIASDINLPVDEESFELYTQTEKLTDSADWSDDIPF